MEVQTFDLLVPLAQLIRLHVATGCKYSNNAAWSGASWAPGGQTPKFLKMGLGLPRPTWALICMRGACAVHARALPTKLVKLGPGVGGCEWRSER